MQNILKKKLPRKKFFASLGTIAVGAFIFKSIPFTSKKFVNNNKNKDIKVKINPLAVSRKNVGRYNG